VFECWLGTVGAGIATGMQNPVMADQRTVPLCKAGQNVPCSRHNAQREKIPEADKLDRQNMDLGCAGGTVRLLQGFSRSVESLSILSPITRVKWCRDLCRAV
jgi:hypothetical protein